MQTIAGAGISAGRLGHFANSSSKASGELHLFFRKLSPFIFSEVAQKLPQNTVTFCSPSPSRLAAQRSPISALRYSHSSNRSCQNLATRHRFQFFSRDSPGPHYPHCVPLSNMFKAYRNQSCTLSKWDRHCWWTTLCSSCLVSVSEMKVEIPRSTDGLGIHGLQLFAMNNFRFVHALDLGFLPSMSRTGQTIFSFRGFTYDGLWRHGVTLFCWLSFVYLTAWLWVFYARTYLPKNASKHGQLHSAFFFVSVCLLCLNRACWLTEVRILLKYQNIVILSCWKCLIFLAPPSVDS